MSDKVEICNAFSDHFISAGHLFDRMNLMSIAEWMGQHKQNDTCQSGPVLSKSHWANSKM